MQQDIYKEFQGLSLQWENLQESFLVLPLKQEIESLKKQTLDPTFWEEPERAQKVSQGLASKEKQLSAWQEIKDSLEYLEELWEEKEPSAEEETQQLFQSLNDKIQVFETQLLLSQEYDSYNTILSLTVGNGGQDAEDFTQMLQRMYLRFCEQQGWRVEIIEESLTDDGLKSATYSIKGDKTFGLLKSENGVHRLIRQSPFNAKGLRQTSFSRVEVIPEIEQETDITLEEKDLRIDVFRASGNGGQSVNTTDSAVRITYLPLGISVSCQNEKSQLQNKQTALKVLKSRLLRLQIEQQAQEIQSLKGDLVENSFGSQMRSYTLHPYKMVKDHRTDHEDGNPQKVLDGDLYPFIYAYLKYVSKKK